MPPLDSWLEFTVRTPLLLVPLIIIALLALGGGMLFAYRRQLARNRELAGQLDNLRASSPSALPTQGASTDEAYHHFIYNISHEVSNPLQSIQTHLDNLANCSPQEPGRWKQSHALIAAEVQRLTRLTENLRLLSHLETSGAPTVREPVNLKGVIESVIMAVYENAESRGVRLCYVGPERMARVLGDRDQLYQVIRNLVDNGIKYAKPEGGEVIISAHEEPDRLAVQVSDEGIGIAEADLPHLFDAAYRAPDARTLRRQGTGLGLAIVKKIVEQHGGQIHVESSLGERTVFSFDLPLYVPPPNPNTNKPQ